MLAGKQRVLLQRNSSLGFLAWKSHPKLCWAKDRVNEGRGGRKVWEWKESPKTAEFCK